MKLEPQTLDKSLYPKELLATGAVWSVLVPGRETSHLTVYQESQFLNSSSANVESRPVSLLVQWCSFVKAKVKPMPV